MENFAWVNYLSQLRHWLEKQKQPNVKVLLLCQLSNGLDPEADSLPRNGHSWLHFFFVLHQISIKFEILIELLKLKTRCRHEKWIMEPLCMKTKHRKVTVLIQNYNNKKLKRESGATKRVFRFITNTKSSLIFNFNDSIYWSTVYFSRSGAASALLISNIQFKSYFFYIWKNECISNNISLFIQYHEHTLLETARDIDKRFFELQINAINFVIHNFASQRTAYW